MLIIGCRFPKYRKNVMKNNEMIKLLSDFAPDAEVVYNDNGIEKPIVLYGWQVGDGGDRAMPNTQLEREKEKAYEVTVISLTSAPNKELEE